MKTEEKTRGWLPGMNYVSEKGKISLIYPSLATMDMYEIYCLEGNLFEENERFSTLKEAESRIRELLD